MTTTTPQPDDLLDSPASAAELGVGQTKFQAFEKLPGFAVPVWLGERTKRYVRSELRAWALQQRTRPSQPRADEQREQLAAVRRKQQAAA